MRWTAFAASKSKRSRDFLFARPLDPDILEARVLAPARLVASGKHGINPDTAPF